jgi:hypothetical protein
VQDAFEVRVAHADFPHVVERVADIVDARAALADALGHQARPPMQVELAHVRGMLRVGEEGKRAHLASGGQARLHEPGRVHPARHLAVPQVTQRPPHARALDAERHAPARAALA